MNKKYRLNWTSLWAMNSFLNLWQVEEQLANDFKVSESKYSAILHNNEKVRGISGMSISLVFKGIGSTSL